MPGPREAALLAELVAADLTYAALLDELDELVRQTAEVRARADAVALVIASVPGERARIAAALREATAEARERSETLREAELELAAAESRGDPERLAAARRFRVRAGDALAMAERRLGALEAEQAGLEERAAAADREAPEVEARAAGLAGTLRARPRVATDAGRVPPGLAGVSSWAAGARAALLVARGGVAGEREAVVRQANELGSMLLGEALAAASVQAVARRIEQARIPGSP